MNLKLNKKFIEDLEGLIKERRDERIKNKLISFFPQDIAEIISLIEFEKGEYLLKLFNERTAEILIELDEITRKKIITNLSPKIIAKDIILKLETDDATDLIQEMPSSIQAEVLSHLKNKKYSKDLVDLLSYESRSAGALMAKELIKVKKNWSVLRCLVEMRKQAKGLEKVYTIYVIDDDEKLLGTVSLKTLLLANEKISIEQIYNKKIIFVQTNTTDEEVSSIMNKYDLVVLPVINNFGKLVGIITIDDVVDFIKEEAEKEYQIASGILENIESNDNLFTLIKARIPWLIIGLFGGIIGAKIVGLFISNDNDIEIAFVPLIAAMAGNIGIQSSALMVQDLANKKNIVSWKKKFFKELFVALFNGLICGIIIFLFCSYFYDNINYYFPLKISISLVVVMIYAALFGNFIPLFFHKININPALATGPFITTTNDVVGLFIYFVICNYIFL